MKNKTANKLYHSGINSKLSDEKIDMGSIKGKYPVVLDGGKTIVYIDDESKIEETRLKYELLKKSRFPSQAAK